MKKQTVVGIIIGAAVGTAAAVAGAIVVSKIVKPVKARCSLPRTTPLAYYISPLRKCP